MAATLTNSWSGTRGLGTFNPLPDDIGEAKEVLDQRIVSFEQRRRRNMSGKLLGLAWDKLIEWFGEETVPELEDMTAMQIVNMYLEL